MLLKVCFCNEDLGLRNVLFMVLPRLHSASEALEAPGKLFTKAWIGTRNIRVRTVENVSPNKHQQV